MLMSLSIVSKLFCMAAMRVLWMVHVLHNSFEDIVHDSAIGNRNKIILYEFYESYHVLTTGYSDYRCK